MQVNLKTIKMLVKGFLIGSMTGITLGTGLSLVMPPNETFTSFTFDQNVALSNNPQTPNKFQIGNRTFSAYKIDDARLARSIASKQAVIDSLNDINTKAIALSEIEESDEKMKIQKTN
jgi:hypothetical protein